MYVTDWDLDNSFSFDTAVNITDHNAFWFMCEHFIVNTYATFPEVWELVRSLKVIAPGAVR